MKKPHYGWAVCIACLFLFLCNMGLCSNILTIYLPFIEDRGIPDSMGSAILSVGLSPPLDLIQNKPVKNRLFSQVCCFFPIFIV